MPDRMRLIDKKSRLHFRVRPHAVKVRRCFNCRPAAASLGGFGLHPGRLRLSAAAGLAGPAISVVFSFDNGAASRCSSPQPWKNRPSWRPCSGSSVASTSRSICCCDSGKLSMNIGQSLAHTVDIGLDSVIPVPAASRMAAFLDPVQGALAGQRRNSGRSPGGDALRRCPTARRPRLAPGPSAGHHGLPHPRIPVSGKRRASVPALHGVLDTPLAAVIGETPRGGGRRCEGVP